MADDTFVEQPDTPAPVFAARAFKRAIFGTPAVPSQLPAPKQDKAGATRTEKITKPADIDSKKYESPSKPAGILLTPGTATSRRKRVSFGREVKSTAAFGDSASRPRTRLQEALENSRKQKNKGLGEDDAKRLDFDPEDIDGDDAWEEVDKLDRDPDMTVDLNDPRSQSGRYWKSEFQKYHGEARVEMEKLVKYKQLAKSYAKAKDAEALDLNERLREEQVKVTEMERRVAEMTGDLSRKEGQAEGPRDDKKIMRDLTRQTALAAQYKKQVEELETLLKESGYAANGSRPRGDASLRGTQTRELERMRQELQRIKSDQTTTEQRELEIETEKETLAADLAKSTKKVEELEQKLLRSEQDRERKDKQLEKLRATLDTLQAKDKVQSEETGTLKRGRRTSRSLAADVLRDEPDSTERNAAAPWAKKLDELEAQLKNEREARRRDMEDASVTIDRLREEYKTAAEFKSPLARTRRSDLRIRSEGRLSTLDNDTTDIFPARSLSTKKHTNVPARPAARGSKRTSSGRIIGGVERAEDKSATTVRLRRLRTIKEELQKSSPRRQDRPVLQEQKQQDLPMMTDEGPSRTMLSSERRAAAIARLEQKRAERRRAQGGNSLPGKENAGLYEDYN